MLRSTALRELNVKGKTEIFLYLGSQRNKFRFFISRDNWNISIYGEPKGPKDISYWDSSISREPTDQTEIFKNAGSPWLKLKLFSIQGPHRSNLDISISGEPRGQTRMFLYPRSPEVKRRHFYIWGAHGLYWGFSISKELTGQTEIFLYPGSQWVIRRYYYKW